MKKYQKANKTNKTNKNKTRKHYRTIILKGGEQLPQTEVKTVVIPPMESLEVSYKNGMKQNGGALPENYHGRTWGKFTMSVFSITSEQLDTFKKIVNSPMDCVISAMQIIGILDFFSSNVLRLTSVGRTYGITLEEIENIFSLRTNNKFVFKSTTSAAEFDSTIQRLIPINHVVFCGVEYNNQYNTRHVMLIGKNNDGEMVQIDPQLEVPICYLNNNNICFKNVSHYFLLFNYEGELTTAEKIQMGIYLF